MALVTVQQARSGSEYLPSRNAAGQGRWYCEQLERGHILFFSGTPFSLPDDERAFLLRQRQVGASYHKNIAYRPHQDRVTGFVKRRREERERFRTIMRSYSQRVTRFLGGLLPPYAGSWKLDYASFRPQEEAGRDLRPRARNDLLHIDAFPTRPTHGGLILRVFTNIHQTRSRRWLTSDPFEVVVKQFAGSSGLPLPKPLDRTMARIVWGSLVKGLQSAGVRVVLRSPYDEFMLRFHHYLKMNERFQTTCQKQMVEFPPGSTWIVFTDMLTHAVLSGQYALEQTFIVPREALIVPDRAPISVLEGLVGAPLAATHQ